MEKALQQRLVGAIALVALGVIFIPALLDGSGYKSRQERSVEIPDKPSFPPLNQTRVEPIATPIDKRKEVIEEKKKVDPPAPVQSWALQVGTFEQENNANAFRDKLRKAGHAAYVDSSKDGGKTTYRVRIGPELDKSRVEKLETQLKKEMKIDGFVVQHP